LLFLRGNPRKESKIQNPKSKIVYLAGPTGAGKTALAVELAERLDAEIVGADAFQIYEGLPILTAQPGAEALRRVPHHLVGCVPVGEAFDVQRYAVAARGAIDGILARGRRVIVAGGTGLYFRALIDGLAPTPAADVALRAELDGMELAALVQRLAAADPAAPAQVDLCNKRRVTRAIEIVEGSGRPLADFRATPRNAACGLLLVREREEMQRRIESSVCAMFDNGVVDEVRAIGDAAGPTASRAIGFREIQELLRGSLTRAECEQAMIVTTRQYAKRQLTWFRRQTTFSPLDLTGMQTPAVESALGVLDLK
jgi:tRNA dimethylallyltransferase